MIRRLGVEQTAVDMAKFVVAPATPQPKVQYLLAPEPKSILPTSKQLVSFARRATVYTGIPLLIATGALAACAAPPPPPCILPNLSRLQAAETIGETIKDRCELPNIHANPKLYEHLGIKETDPDIKAVVKNTFSKIFEVPIQVMNRQFDKDTIKKGDMYIFGMNSINGYAAQTVINGNHFIFIANNGDGAWVRVPPGAETDALEDGNAEVYQLGDSIMFMPVYRIGKAPVSNITGIFIRSKAKVSPEERVKINNFYTTNSDGWANWVIKRIMVDGVKEPFYVFDEETWEMIETDIDGVGRRFPADSDGKIGKQKNR